jgi:acyl-CoA reductase-like NAD-dependent aldehyde dehydrogenase
VTASEFLTVHGPADGALLRRVPCDSPAEVDRKLAAADAARRRWRRRPLEARLADLASALEFFRREEEAVARGVTVEVGKPIVQARGEVATLRARAETLLALAPSALAPLRPPALPGFERRIEREPVGVVLVIAAWNYPLIVPLGAIVSALAAGNAVVLKHSPRSPGAGEQWTRALATLPEPDVFQHVIVPDARAGALVDDPRIAHVAFTGSVATGRAVQARAASRGIAAGLELGGKDPAYVAEDADLAFAVANVVDGACYNAGQSCCAVERVYVHAARYDDFLAEATRLLGSYRLGDPLDETTTLGPLIDAAALERVQHQVADARVRGARVLQGGERHGTVGWFHQPTLLADCPDEALAMREETFGPLLPVRAVQDDEEALACMNASRYGLTASVWTRDAARADRMASELEAGTVFQNRCDFLDPALAWTGWKDSGLGSSLSELGFHALTRARSVHLRR